MAFLGKIIEKKSLTDNVRWLTMELSSGLNFIAGQFVMCRIPTAGGFVERAYSICSSPNEPERLTFCYKLLPGGVATQYFEQAPLGTMVELRGPLGRFTFRPGINSILCVASGTGIAPFRSMLTDALIEKKDRRPIKLLFGVRTPADIFWQDTFQDLALRYKNFSFEITLSRPDESWNGPTGRVTDHISDQKYKGAEDFYLCGSPPMILDCRDKLIKAGVAPARIYFEVFA